MPARQQSASSSTVSIERTRPARESIHLHTYAVRGHIYVCAADGAALGEHAAGAELGGLARRGTPQPDGCSRRASPRLPSPMPPQPISRRHRPPRPPRSSSQGSTGACWSRTQGGGSGVPTRSSPSWRGTCSPMRMRSPSAASARPVMSKGRRRPVVTGVVCYSKKQ